MRAPWPVRCRLLVIRLDASGDLLMCTPALRALAQAGHDLSVLTSSAGAMVATRCDMIHQVLTFDSPWMKASADCSALSTRAMANILRSASFDGAVIMHSYSQSPLPAAMLCHLAGIPRQLAYCRENPYQLITDWLKEPEPESLCRHEVQRQLDLVCALSTTTSDTRLSLSLTDADHAAAQQALDTLGLSPAQDFLLVHPGASAASRRYPSGLLEVVVSQLGYETGLPLVLAGGSDDQAVLPALRKAAGSSCAGAVPALDFGGLAALISKARLLLSNNSAPAHLAAATQTPVVVLYALTNPQHTPWQVPSKVLFRPVPCAPCYRSICPQLHHECLSGVTPARVIAAIADLLEETDACYQDPCFLYPSS